MWENLHHNVVDVSEEEAKLAFSIIKSSFDCILAINIHTGIVEFAFDNVDNAMSSTIGMSYRQAVRTIEKHYLAADDANNPRTHYTIKELVDFLGTKEKITFTDNVRLKNGEIRNKHVVLHYLDEKKAVICFEIADITDQLREKQDLLFLLADVVDRAVVINTKNDTFILQTTETVQQQRASFKGENGTQPFREASLLCINEEEKEKMLQTFTKQQILADLARNPQGYSKSFRFKVKGEVRVKIYKIFWLDAKEQDIGVLRMDITQEERREQLQKEALAKALKLAKEANVAKSEFLSSISHDIRTPMNAILGLTDLLLASREKPDQDKTKIYDAIGTIKTASYQLMSLINDVLDLKRIESGRMVLSKEPFDMHKAWELLISKSKALTAHKEQKLVCNLNIQHNYYIGDELKLQRMLDNIIGNAVKFTPQGGTITVSAEEGSHENPFYRTIHYTVKDTGIGMSPEVKEKIFEPFYREQTSDNCQEEGSGLGMAIVKRIVEFGEGTIDIDSAPGKGATVRIALPLRLAERVKDTTPEEAKGDFTALEGKKILLAEDNKINQLVSTTVLKNGGMLYTLAGNGQAAVEIFQQSKPKEFAAILMDVRMPVMDGYTATKKIRQLSRPDAQTIPIFAMTANAFAEDVQKNLAAGMNDHLTKPIVPAYLYRKLVKATSTM